MQISLSSEEMTARLVSFKSKTLDANGEFILVWLRRALCGHDNPAIDAGIDLSNQHNIPVVVFSQVSGCEPHLNDRLAIFSIGANKELGKDLANRGIQHLFGIDLKCNHHGGSQYLQSVHKEIIQRAACVVFDQHFTPYERMQSTTVANSTSKAVVEVDATRLIPHSQLTGSLHITKKFRAAHSPLRKTWYALRQDLKIENDYATIQFSNKTTNILALSSHDIKAFIAASDIDHSVHASQEHLPSRTELNQRLRDLPAIVERYRGSRNNPAIATSTSKLSPYLHFGMTSVFEILRVLEQSTLARTVMWKFLDELLTWREWSHWRLAKRPDFTEFASLPNSAISTLHKHQSDPRDVLLTKQQLFDGETPDDLWNAAQLHWRNTGWLHNNLRMYWATQILSWTATPEEAWRIATEFNDKQSLDGQEPACYISMRWAFGESKPAYSEKPIYGWVAKKSDRALRKRVGLEEWIDKTLKAYQQ